MTINEVSNKSKHQYSVRVKSIEVAWINQTEDNVSDTPKHGHKTPVRGLGYK